MKYRISLLVMAVVCGGSEGSATEMAWLEVDTLESRLAGSDHTEVPVSELLPEGRILCAVGSYASDLPEGYDTAKEDLENAGLLPVAEGNGLLFSVDEERHLHSAFALSVWPDTVILDVAEPLCIPAASAQIDLRKDTRSLIIKLERRE
ncbi:hypothetical protein [Rhodovulum sulfidophilum]|uniref:hypothetical protein n=1 Tax=Rhodovulum sulfidophilum TaxID=35806 RepID=UPI001F251E65|nr:hypothetical protein [Rhodovulum sulfidophilum]MCE8439998.1 hypothetical protein [Rhodovulum sulfidophilum]MCE8467483.1 hypothetical protein [Rhodovulum sulfidophilum]